MNKREHTQANKDWLTAKAKEEAPGGSTLIFEIELIGIPA